MCNPKPERPPQVVWQDLKGLTRVEQIRELMLPLPWFLGSWWLFSGGLWPFGAIASFMFFLCALRLNHEAIHSNLGLGRKGDSVVMHVLSGLMLGSNHAEAWCHLRHHRFSMGPDDHEGRCGQMTAWQVLWYGPRFPIDINIAAWQSQNTKWRRRMIVDWVICLALIGLTVVADLRFLWLHLAAMITAQSLAAFFAVWLTHRGLEGSGIAARSQRGWVAQAAYLMFYHREHHLFPAVPVSRLPKLASRLDKSAPGFAEQRRPVLAWADRRP